MNNENKPNYFAILTAEVRYDKRLNPLQKLLYAELTALSNAQGFAWPSNSYLAELYDVSELTISRNIKALKDSNYITIIEEKTSKGTIRKIYISTTKNVKKVSEPLIKNDNHPLIKNDNPPLIKNDECLYINNTRDLIIQDININRENINSSNLDNTPQIDNSISLSLVEKLGLDLGINKTVSDKFYHYFKARDFKTKDNIKITKRNVKNLLIYWNSNENQNTIVVNTSEPKVNKPKWLDEYMKEIQEMEG